MTAPTVRKGVINIPACGLVAASVEVRTVKTLPLTLGVIFAATLASPVRALAYAIAEYLVILGSLHLLLLLLRVPLQLLLLLLFQLLLLLQLLLQLPILLQLLLQLLLKLPLKLPLQLPFLRERIIS